jgi:NADH-quinone oxidoreductase subunit E
MGRLTKENVDRARLAISRYPHKRSAMMPLLHLVQEQDGHLTTDGMAHVAELLELTPAEVYGTASFYEMFKHHEVGRYLVNVCTNVSCMLLGAYELLDHIEERLGVSAGATTEDGVFTIEEVECVAACTQAPCVLVNYRVFGPLSHADADGLLDDLRAGRLADDVPPHGVTNRVRQQWPAADGSGPAVKAPGTPAAGRPTQQADSPPSPAPAAQGTETASKDATAPTRRTPRKAAGRPRKDAG